MSEWQPISTAPKDGEHVDLWAHGQRRADCFWVQDDPDCGYWRQCYAEFPSGAFDLRYAPTHWMEIPEGPK